MFKNFISLCIIFIGLVALISSSAAINAQAPVLTSPGDGSTSTVQGIIIAQSQFNNASGYGLFVPYWFSTTEVAATNSSDPLLIVHSNGQSAKAFEWNIVWTFNAGEAATVRAWLATRPHRNNNEVQFTATWQSGRFAIDTTTWTFLYQSLMPFGILPSCNITSMVMSSRMALAAIPDNCQTVLVPGQRARAQQTPECLIMHGRTAVEINNACNTVRAFLESIYCLDGAAGADLVCGFNSNFLPNGVPGPMVVTVGADGFPTSGRPTPPPPPSASAGSVLTGSVAIIIAVLAATMI